MAMALFSLLTARILALAVLFALGILAERVLPADPRTDFRGILLNCSAGFFFLLSEAMAAMLVASLFIHFSWTGVLTFLAVPDRGNLLRCIALAFSWLAFRDFFYYWLHRFQHRSKWLWAEHALHHSEEHLNITTSVRHHWLEMPLNTIFVLAPFMYLFRPPLLTIPLVSFFISMIGVLTHSNVKIGLGRFGWLIANPQNHRIHHSRLPEHLDKNFAQFFPIWDVLFGTYYAPRPDEYPPTGLSSGEQVTTLRKSLLLPFIEWRKMLTRRA
jgi:sterol desaturase/sphingolipid hydroxylase (fatty acid hydroxylase superfamily)